MAFKNIADLIGLKDSRNAQHPSHNKSSSRQSVSMNTVAVKTAQEVSSGATENSRLLQVVSQYVPNEVLPHLCFVRLEQNQLRLTVSNAAAATRLRFSGQNLKNGLATAEGIQVDRVSVHVKPREEFTFQQRRTDARPATVSDSTIKLIESAAATAEHSARQERNDNADQQSESSDRSVTADSVEEDPLARALKRLAVALTTKR